jgi:hypothetical protein
MKIQRRENDLIGASFGRGFFVLDDYSPLRHVSGGALKSEAHLFPVRKALQYVPDTPFGRRAKGTQGAGYYTAENPPYGAVFTYHLKEGLKTRQQLREEKDNQLEKQGKGVRYPDWTDLRREDREIKPHILLTVRDQSGSVVRRLKGPADKGFHRVAWDLRHPQSSPIRLSAERREAWEAEEGGPMVLPAEYTVTLAKVVDGQTLPLGQSREFEVVPLTPDTFDATLQADILAFQKKTARLQRAATGSRDVIAEVTKRLKFILKALRDTPNADPGLFGETMDIRTRLLDLQIALQGDWTRRGRSEPVPPSILDRIYAIVYGHWDTRMAPTRTQRESYKFAAAEFSTFLDALRTLVETDLKALEKKIESSLAPWTPHRGVPVWKDQ